MRRAHALLVPLIAIGLSGCFLKKTPVVKAAPPAPKPVAAPAPAPPPEPLSVPQTNVQLPPPQPLTPEAIASTQPQEETPLPAPPARTGGRSPGSRPGSVAQPRPADPAPPPVTAPPVAAPEPERMPLQEVLPATEIKRLQDEATARKREARQLVDQAHRRRLTRQQSGMVDRILSFIQQAEDAERRGDMRQASELAERALVLARELKP